MNERLEETKMVRLTFEKDPRVHLIVTLSVDKIKSRIAKIEKNIEKLRIILAKTKNNLANEDFINNAPPDVIETEIMKQASFKARLTAAKIELKDLKLALEDERQT